MGLESQEGGLFRVAAVGAVVVVMVLGIGDKGLIGSGVSFGSVGA